jgi:ion channel-forming bestrophin family protein
MPIAYSITLAQISWVYILVLPFQVINKLSWMTIPATILAAYIILGLGAIGAELENPFGDGVNDLPLEDFCDQIQLDCDIIMSKTAPKASQFIKQIDNMPLYPLYMNGYADWASRSKEEIAEALRAKVDIRGTAQGLIADQGGKV